MVRQFVIGATTVLILGIVANCEGQTTTQEGKYFRIICHFENEKLAAEALKTAEMVWPTTTDLLALKTKAPEKPLEIHLFSKLEDYEKTEDKLTGGRFRKNLAFAHFNTRAAYILVQPPCSAKTLKRVRLPAQTRRLIAHEAAHLVCYVTMPNYRSHPQWFSEGIATWVEEKVRIAGHWSPSIEEDPYQSTLILQAAKLIEKDAMPSVKDILNDRTDDIQWNTCYAARWLLFRYMKESLDAKKFQSITDKARLLGAGSEYKQQLYSFIEETLGQDEMKAIDTKFKSYVQAMKPQWEEVFRSLETTGKNWIQMAFPDKNAIAWHTQPVGKDAYTLEGKLRILPAAGKQMNLLLGRTPDGFVSVALYLGGVTIFDYHDKENRWERLGNAPSEAIKLDEWVRFRVEVGEDQVRVTLDKTPTLTVSLKGRSMRGPWGLGVQSGSAGAWRKVELK